MIHMAPHLLQRGVPSLNSWPGEKSKCVESIWSPSFRSRPMVAMSTEQSGQMTVSPCFASFTRLIPWSGRIQAQLLRLRRCQDEWFWLWWLTLSLLVCEWRGLFQQQRSILGLRKVDQSFVSSLLMKAGGFVLGPRLLSRCFLMSRNNAEALAWVMLFWVMSFEIALNALLIELAFDSVERLEDEFPFLTDHLWNWECEDKDVVLNWWVSVNGNDEGLSCDLWRWFLDLADLTDSFSQKFFWVLNFLNCLLDHAEVLLKVCQVVDRIPPYQLLVQIVGYFFFNPQLKSKRQFIWVWKRWLVVVSFLHHSFDAWIFWWVLLHEFTSLFVLLSWEVIWNFAKERISPFN